MWESVGLSRGASSDAARDWGDTRGRRQRPQSPQPRTALAPNDVAALLLPPMPSPSSRPTTGPSRSSSMISSVRARPRTRQARVGRQDDLGALRPRSNQGAVPLPGGPARSAGARSDVLEAVEEHHVVKWLLTELERTDPTDERFNPRVTVLIEERPSPRAQRGAGPLPRSAALDGTSCASFVLSWPTRRAPSLPEPPPSRGCRTLLPAIFVAGHSVAERHRHGPRRGRRPQPWRGSSRSSHDDDRVGRSSRTPRRCRRIRPHLGRVVRRRTDRTSSSSSGAGWSN